MCFRRSLSSLAALLLSVGSVAAQTEAPPPHLSVLDGRAEITRGQDREAAVANTPLVLGDRLATSDGRAEVLLGDGSALHLDAQTTAGLQRRLRRPTADRASHRLWPNGGRRQPADRRRAGIGARAVVGGSAHGTVRRPRPGTAAGRRRARDWSTSTAAARRCRCKPASRCWSAKARRRAIRAPFNSARLDGFARWSQELLDARRGATSTQYLPADVRVYGSTFDQYGIVELRGAVRLRLVSARRRDVAALSPRPLAPLRAAMAGRSSAGDPWGWPTHHYGRWGLNAAGAWFWIPQAGWGAAWVNWAVAPGYVGWCPLGWNNRPVVGFWGHGSRRRITAAGVSTTTRGAPGRSCRPTPSGSGSPIHQQRFDAGQFRGPRAPTSSCSRRPRRSPFRADRSWRPAHAWPARRWRRATGNRAAARRWRPSSPTYRAVAARGRIVACNTAPG